MFWPTRVVIATNGGYCFKTHEQCAILFSRFGGAFYQMLKE
jgi:hypothetical protein